MHYFLHLLVVSHLFWKIGMFGLEIVSLSVLSKKMPKEEIVKTHEVGPKIYLTLFMSWHLYWYFSKSKVIMLFV